MQCNAKVQVQLYRCINAIELTQGFSFVCVIYVYTQNFKCCFVMKADMSFSCVMFPVLHMLEDLVEKRSKEKADENQSDSTSELKDMARNVVALWNKLHEGFDKVLPINY